MSIVLYIIQYIYTFLLLLPSTLERIKLKVSHKRHTWVLNLDSGVGLGMRFVNYLCAHLLRQNLVQGVVRRHSAQRTIVQ